MLSLKKIFTISVVFLFISGLAPFKAEGPNTFTIARIKYPGGGDWYSNPSSLPNLLAALNKRLEMKTTLKQKVIELTDPNLFLYPVLYMNGHGNIKFTEKEVKKLRLYLERGGFLFADDNYGMDKSFRREIKRVFPEANLIELPLDHEIYHSHYDLPEGPPKVHEHDGLPPQGLGIYYQGRLVVFYTYQSDIGDGIEDAEVHNDPPAIREKAMQMAINVIIYALTH